MLKWSFFTIFPVRANGSSLCEGLVAAALFVTCCGPWQGNRLGVVESVWGRFTVSSIHSVLWVL